MKALAKHLIEHNRSDSMAPVPESRAEASKAKTAQTAWHRQLRDSITCPVELADRINLAPHQRAFLEAVAQRYPLRITPYYFGLMDPRDPNDPIRRQCVPLAAELADTRRNTLDPFDEVTHSADAGVIHRYANRVVFLVHNECAVRCRHCTRKNTWSVMTGKSRRLTNRLSAAVAYIDSRPTIHEVILSGGDPFLMETPDLAHVIDTFRAIPHVGVIRIGTRVPVSLPMRVDSGLCRMLSRRRPLWINTHFNHPREITHQAATACDRLLRAGIPCSNQTVLLRGVNDQLPVLQLLCEELFQIMVRPYYLFDADPVRGTAHFRVSPRRGRALYRQLRASLSGLALPRYAADIAGLPSKQILA